MLRRRRNSNPEKSFREACSENNIILTEEGWNDSPVSIIDDRGVKVEVSSENDIICSPYYNRICARRVGSLAMRTHNRDEERQILEEVTADIIAATNEQKIAKRKRKRVKLSKAASELNPKIKEKKEVY